MLDAVVDFPKNADANLAAIEKAQRQYASPYAPQYRKPYMFMFIFIAWIAALAWFGPRLVGLVQTAQTPFMVFALGYFAVFTTLAWLYGLYNIGVVLFSTAYRRFVPQWTPPALISAPSVAVLYTTCNDFVEESAESCLKIEYANYHLYILDDSTSAIHKKRIDQFARQYADRVTVIRRPDRTGFKAGNLNFTLENRIAEPYFAVVDADELVPPDFLTKLVPYMETDPDCGFVQANHRCNENGATRLQRDMRLGIDVHWKWYQPLRNKFGFVMFLGHGVLLRRSCWEKAGGFPEIVSEDLAYAIALREQGSYGVFAEDVMCVEAFPETVRAFRIRHVKWTRGTCEFLHRWGPRLIKSKRIPVIEKLDILFPTVNLPLTFFFFIFMALAGLVLPLTLGGYRTMTIELGGLDLSFGMLSLPPEMAKIFTPDFYAITILTLVAPILCFVFELWKTPLKLARFLGHSTALYAALSPLSSICVIGYALTRRAKFLVTGDVNGGASKNTRLPIVQSAKRFFSETHPDFRGVQYFEWLAASIFLAGAIVSFQIALIGLAVGFMLLPVMHHEGWDNAVIRRIDFLPSILIAAGIGLGGLGLFGLQPVLFGFGFHF